MQTNRNSKKWSVNEILSLQREYELLELSIQQIALRHQRSVEAILYKLQEEEMIGKDWSCVKGWDEYYQTTILEETMTSSDSSSRENELQDRVWSLETSVSEIKNMVKQMVNQFMDNKKQKKQLQPLRKMPNQDLSL
jgi:hypothetical protein